MKQSRAELELAYHAQRSELDRTAEALACIADGNGIKVGQFTLDSQTVKATLINPARAHGGILMLSSTMRGEHSMHRVYYLEQQEIDLRHASSEYAYGLRQLVGKARVLANNAIASYSKPIGGGSPA